MIKILIFGSNGFIGKNLTEYLLKKKALKIIYPTRQKCNLLNKKQTNDFIKKTRPNIIINTAFYGGVSSKLKLTKRNVSNNIKIVTNIINGSKDVNEIKKVFFLGSSLEYLNQTKKSICEKTKIDPKNNYASIKAITSKLAIKKARQNKVPLILLRSFNLYGSYHYEGVIYYLIKSILLKRKYFLTKGEHQRDYLFIEDFIKIIYQCINKRDYFKNFEAYNIGSGETIKLKKIFKIISSQLDTPLDYEIVPDTKNDYLFQKSDNSKIKKIIKIKPLTPILKGIKKTIIWVKKDSNYV